MNARIKEIEIQSVFFNEETQTWEFDREKFAELIVRECIGIDFRHKIGLSSDDDYEVSRVIKQHFGIER